MVFRLGLGSVHVEGVDYQLQRAVVIGGLFLVHLSSGYVTISKGAGLQSGNYSIIGTSGSLTYLLPCNTHRPMVSVNTDDLASIRYYKHEPSFVADSLFRTFTHHPFTWGVTFSCPAN